MMFFIMPIVSQFIIKYMEGVRQRQSVLINDYVERFDILKKATNQQLDQIKSEITTITENVQGVNQRLGRMQQRIDDLDSKNKRTNEPTNQRLDQIQYDISALNRNFKGATQTTNEINHATNQRLCQVENGINVLNHSVNQMGQNLGEVQNKLNAVRYTVNVMNKHLGQAQQTIDALSCGVNNLNQGFVQIQQKIDHFINGANQAFKNMNETMASNAQTANQRMERIQQSLGTIKQALCRYIISVESLQFFSFDNKS